ncbi:PREDICTED: tyrosine-protein phosphatase non-receptor type 23-like, partial [Priapulus caudatus]|uniref:Tyrosine-protein phosphatase non-receptor type 23-like n=1 Tax=Priapulus caudatus TaxID=37621 RepID=A0ABM1ECB0_PRICU
MEAVPLMPMISLELKTSPESTDFSAALKKYVKEYYHEDPESYNKEIKELEQLRQNAIKASKDFMGCSVLKRYFAQLHLLQSRFPMSEGGAAAVNFTWADVYTNTWGTYADVKFEMSAIMYNIGALHSVLGTMDNRQTAEVCEFSSVDDGTRGSLPNTDMTRDVLNVYVNIMLAQAQECILEKSMVDHRKSTIIAKVASQVVEYYRQAIKYLDPQGKVQLYVGNKQCKEWQKKLRLKIPYYECVSLLYMGNQSEEQQKWGEGVAYFQASVDKLNEAIKLSSSGDGALVQEALRFTMDVVGGKFNSAKKDNDFIYHEKVPEFEMLEEVKGASLVKGIPFNFNDKDVSGDDIFARLIPMETHEASSLYSEEKAKVLREADTGLTFLSSLQTDQLFDVEHDRLPQPLLERCAALSVRPTAVKDLTTAMKELSDISLDVTEDLNKVHELMESEEQSEKSFQEQLGRRDASLIVAELAKEYGHLKEANARADTSDRELHKVMMVHVNNLRLLASQPEEIKQALPLLELTDEDREASSEIWRLLGKVEEMKEQRDKFEHELREQVQNDDITKALVTMKDADSLEEFFEEQLTKYVKPSDLIQRNLAAQENILRALTDANAKYADTRRKVNDHQQRRETRIESIINSYDIYDDLMKKAKEGIECYKKLQENVTKLLSRVSGAYKVQEEERQQIINRENAKKAKAAPPRPTAPKPAAAAVGAVG